MVGASDFIWSSVMPDMADGAIWDSCAADIPANAFGSMLPNCDANIVVSADGWKFFTSAAVNDENFVGSTPANCEPVNFDRSNPAGMVKVVEPGMVVAEPPEGALVIDALIDPAGHEPSLLAATVLAVKGFTQRAEETPDVNATVAMEATVEVTITERMMRDFMPRTL